jgi:hypothetical protein
MGGFGGTILLSILLDGMREITGILSQYEILTDWEHYLYAVQIRIFRYRVKRRTGTATW